MPPLRLHTVSHHRDGFPNLIGGAVGIPCWSAGAAFVARRPDAHALHDFLSRRYHRQTLLLLSRQKTSTGGGIDFSP